MLQKYRRFLWISRCLLLMGIAHLLWSAPALWAAGVIGNGAPASCTAQAVAAAVAGGGLLTFNCGPAPYTISVTAMVIGAGQKVTLDGDDLITLSGDDVRRPFVVEKGGELTLNHITVSHGAATGNGGAIWNQGALTVNDSTLGESRANGVDAQGGAIYNDGGLLSMQRSALLNNQAANGAGLVNAKGTVVLNTVVVEGNTASIFGGIENNGVLSLFNSVIRNNSTTGVSGYGGGISHQQGSLTIVKSTISGNHSQFYDGGGVAVFDGAATIEQSQILSNTAAIGGGGLYVHPNAAAQVTVRDTLVAGNRTTNQDAPANEVNVFGGGILNGRKLLLERVTVRDNQSSVGGGLFSYSVGEVTVRDSLFVHNSALTEGGALAPTGAHQELTNVTLSGNEGGAYGGGIFGSDQNIDLTNVTFFGNRATEGANLYSAAGGMVTFVNTIFAAAQGSSNCAFTNSTELHSLGYNLASDDSCALTGAGDQQPVANDAGLLPLADYGGATLSHLPQPGSPAIDKGDSAHCPATDQRGYLRNVGAACDVGAIEAGAAPAEPTATPTLSPTPTATELPTPEATTVTTETLPSPVVHPPINNGVKATILLNPTHAWPAQQVTVSGQAPPGYTQVRISATYQGQTLGLQLARVTNGNYTFDFIIPSDAAPGSLELCATPVGAANGEFACIPLQIDAPPLAHLSGALATDVARLGSATLHLHSLKSGAEYVTNIGADGAFNLPDLPAGSYEYQVAGELSKPIASSKIEIPYTNLDPHITLTPAFTCVGLDALHQIGYMTASASRAKGGAPFGLYVSGVQNTITFEAFPQSNGPIESVRFEVQDRNHQVIAVSETSSPPWRMAFNVGRLPPSLNGRHAAIFATPISGGVKGCPIIQEIEMIANPFPTGPFQPNALEWDGAHAYRIRATLPYIPDILPAEFQFPPPPKILQYFGRFANRLNTDIQVQGSLTLDGYVHLTIVNAILEAKLMNQVLFGRDTGLKILSLNVSRPLNEARNLSFPIGPKRITGFHIATPFLSVPVLTFFGVISVNVGGSIGIGGQLDIAGTVQPLAPALGTTLTGVGTVEGTLDTHLSLLEGLADAGVATKLSNSLLLPLSVNAAPDEWSATLKACLLFDVTVEAYVEFGWGLDRESASDTLDHYADCLQVIPAAAKAAVDLDVPDLLTAPALAIAPDGTQLSAYVENTAPAGATPRVQVLARFKAPGAASWSKPLPLTDPAHSARSPAVAFVGPNQMPLVAWAENTLTAAEAAALGDDYSAQLRHQEIAYSTWNGSAWSPVTYVTTDQLGDGLPVLAGSPDGAVLAWTRDLDGDAASRDDQRIAVANFDLNTNHFGPFSLLTAPGGGLNGDVQVTYEQSVSPAQPYVVWVHDSDASLLTADDRTLALATQENGVWILLDTQSLPNRVDSPAISAGADGMHLAFLVRQANPDGTVGLIGTNGMVWSAILRDGQWQAAPLLVNQAQPVYGEDPTLTTQDTETLLLFRRFEQEDDNRRWGQIALSQLDRQAHFATPLYLTDEPRQNWQAALAINPLTRSAEVLKVARASTVMTETQRAINTNQSISAVQSTTLSNDSDPLEALTVAATADPALDPLTVSNANPVPGQMVTATVTVRNLGRAPATGVTVALYQGEPGHGVLLTTASPSDDLAFNGSATLPMSFVATGEETSLYAELATTGPNGNPANDHATFIVGHLSAPQLGTVSASSEYPQALTLAWAMRPEVFVQGYRVLRGATSEGPFAVVGETSVPAFTDTLVERDQPYCYVVQAFSGATRSPQSPAVCGKLALRHLYLPLIQR